MSKRVVLIETPGLYLCEKDRQLEIWLNKERLSKIAIEDLGFLVIENTAMSITGKLLASLATSGAQVILCDEYHLPASLLMPLTGTTLHAHRTRLLVDLSKPIKKQLWKMIIETKIKLQSENIAFDKKASGILERLSKDVLSGDSDNKEANAARVYWQTIFKEYDENYLRSSDSEINKYLNYGYAIIRSAIARSLVNAGLTPLFGIFHKSRDNPFALADDFIEVYRPFVDQWVYKGLKENMLDGKSFKRYLLKLVTTRIGINNESNNFMTAIDLTTDSFVNVIEGKSKTLTLPELCTFQDSD